MKIIITILLISLLFLNTCAEKDPTAPEEEIPTGDLVAEANIGPEGGTLETEDFKLTIPNGAFDQAVELKLLRENSNPSSDNLVSAQFIIQGIPSFYNEPIEVNLKYHKSLSGLVLVKREMETRLTNSDTTLTMMEIELFETTEENGYLKVQFPKLISSNKNISKKNENTTKWRIGAYYNCSFITSDHFTLWSEIYDFSFDPQYSGDLIDKFENAYNRFDQMNFALHDLHTHVSVSFANKNDPWSLSFPPYLYLFTNDWGGMTMQFKDISNLSIYQSNFDKAFARSFFERIYLLDKKTSWITRGIIDWCEYKYGSNGIFNQLWDVFYHSPISYDEYNDGTPIVIDYLVQNYGEEILSAMIHEMSQKWVIDIVAMETFTGKMNTWLTDFYNDLLTSERWNDRIKNYITLDIDLDSWKKLATHQTIIDDVTDQVIWSETYEPLCAKLINIDLSNTSNENGNLTFSIEGDDCEFILYAFDSGNFINITKSNGTVSKSINELKQVSDANNNLFALVINKYVDTHYKENSDITLTIEKSHFPRITSCLIKIDGVNVIRRTYDNNGEYSDTEYIFFGNFNSQPEPTPTFENNIFYQAYSYTDNQDYILSGNFSIEFSKNLDTILTFSVYHKEDRTLAVNPESPIYGIFEKGVSGADIPLINSYEKNIYEVSGMDVCECINNNIKWSSSGYDNWETISITGCDTQSKLTIEVTKSD